MLGQKKAKRIVDQVMAHSQAGQTEVVLLSTDNSLTRFANSRIHQNVSEHNVQVRVRAVSGKRVGVASTNDLTDRSLREASRQALQIALLQPENPDFQSLPAPRQLANISAFAEATAACTPQEHAEAVNVVCRLAKDSGLIASGAFATECMEIVVANSLGLFAYSPGTVSELTTVVMSDDSSGGVDSRVSFTASTRRLYAGRPHAVNVGSSGSLPSPHSRARVTR